MGRGMLHDPDRAERGEHAGQPGRPLQLAAAAGAAAATGGRQAARLGSHAGARRSPGAGATDAEQRDEHGDAHRERRRSSVMIVDSGRSIRSAAAPANGRSRSPRSGPTPPAQPIPLERISGG